MDKEAMKRLKAGRFKHNNGLVLRTVNIMRYKYVKLTEVAYALPDLDENQLLDSVNYLSEGGYIRLRLISSKAETTIADTDYTLLEAKLTDEGIKLLSGDINDTAVDV